MQDENWMNLVAQRVRICEVSRFERAKYISILRRDAFTKLVFLMKNRGETSSLSEICVND